MLMEELKAKFERNKREDYVIARLGYNVNNERFGILYMDSWEDNGLHCGEPVIYWNSTREEWVESSIEMDLSNKWYIVDAEDYVEHGDLEYVNVLYPCSSLNKW